VDTVIAYCDEMSKSVIPVRSGHGFAMGKIMVSKVVLSVLRGDTL